MSERGDDATAYESLSEEVRAAFEQRATVIHKYLLSCLKCLSLTSFL
jgi:hypothetical protein